jgi:hypothetical protein
MSTRQSIIVGASVICSSLILGMSFGSRAIGQSSVSPAASGRYQIVVTQQHVSTACNVIVFEPSTGHCWYRETRQSTWEDLGSPNIRQEK